MFSFSKNPQKAFRAGYSGRARVLSFPLIFVLLVSLFLTIPASAANTGGFRDISKTQWWYSWVRPAYEQGLMEGVGDDLFDPSGSLTRGMYVTVLGRMAGVDPSAYPDDLFTDVSYADWYGGYVNWAAGAGITEGVDDGKFAPDQSITRQEMAVLISRYLTDDGSADDTSDSEPEQEQEPLSDYITDAGDVADWAKDGVLDLAKRGLMTGDENHLYRPAETAIRAEAAALFVRLGRYLNGGADLPTVKPWTDWVDPATIYEVPAFSDPILSGEDIISSAKSAGIPGNSTAFQALISINTVYASHLSAAARSGTLLFLFEGSGAAPTPEKRQGAMAVVVKNRKIVHINRHCSTIPDWPFSPAQNAGRAMPTLMSGIYDFTTCNHMTKSYCAALHVVNDRVLRFSSPNSWYEATSGQINIHRRYRDYIVDWESNSQGCLLIGAAGTEPYDEYAQYASALGIINSGEPGTRYYQHYITGKVVIDRSFGRDYLRSVGYSDAALNALG